MRWALGHQLVGVESFAACRPLALTLSESGVEEKGKSESRMGALEF